VRVRRLKNHGYRVELIGSSCADQIREFQELVIPEGVAKEFWVRGPEQAWRWYRILPETIEAHYSLYGHPPKRRGGYGSKCV